MKQKRQIGVLFILITAAAIVWGWNFHDKRVVTADASPTFQEPQINGVENPHIKMEEIGRARSTEYKGSGRNPFSPAAVPVVRAPKVPDKKDYDYGPKPPAPTPPPPPLTLPANVKFYGYGALSGAARRAYFYDGDEVQILGEGDVLLKRFRIIRIGNDHIEFEEISTGRVGTSPLDEQGGPGQPQ